MAPFSINWHPSNTSSTAHEIHLSNTAGEGGPNALFHADALSTATWLVGNGETFDCIYMDPPFGTAKRFKTKRGRGSYQDYEVESLLELLYPVLSLTPQLLVPAGNIFIHLDHRAVWGVKLIMDTLFGVNRFQNQIVWHYQSGGRAKKRYSRKHDVILWYSKGAAPYFDPTQVLAPRDECSLCGLTKKSSHLKTVVDEQGQIRKAIKSNGKMYYYDPEAGRPLSDVWMDIGHLHQLDPERSGYPTQKPLKLLRRIVGAHSPLEGRVLDLFAGSGTTLVAAAQLGRGFVGADKNDAALSLIRERLAESGARYQSFASSVVPG